MVAGAASTGLLVVIGAALEGPSSRGALVPAFAALCLLLPAARFASVHLLARLGEGVTATLRLRLSERILTSPLRRLEELGSARLLATLTDDVSRVSQALSIVPLLVLHLTVIGGCVAYMGWLSPPLLGVVLAMMLLGVVTYRLPIRRAVEHFREARQHWDDLVGHFRGLTEGTKELKMHRRRRREFFSRLLAPTAHALRHHNAAGGTLSGLANSWGQALFFVLIGLILFLLAGRFGLGERETTGFTLAVLFLLTPLDVVLTQMPLLGRAMVALDQVERLGLELANGDDAAPDAAPPAAVVWHRLELAGVAHRFLREDRLESFVLGPLDLTLTPGELLFVIGGNGSGKTTLAKLLVGLYPPEQGEVRLDGVVVDDAGRDAYRQLFSAVFADCFLFERLLGLDLDGRDLDREARSYMRRLHLDTKVDVTAGRLSSLDLSQGQRKRLALLTAYLEDRPIYLFDEWAADQDPLFKEIFYHQLLPELRRRGKTVVVITHDDRYFDVADRIVRLEEGRLAPLAAPGAAAASGEWLEAAEGAG